MVTGPVDSELVDLHTGCTCGADPCQRGHRISRGEHQIQCFVYSRDPECDRRNTFRMDLFDEIIGRTGVDHCTSSGSAMLALDRPVELAPRE